MAIFTVPMAVRHTWHGHFARKCCVPIIIGKLNANSDPLGRSRKRRTFREHVTSAASCSCLDSSRQSDSDNNIPGGHFTRGEDPSRFHDESWKRQEEAVATSKRARTSMPPWDYHQSSLCHSASSNSDVQCHTNSGFRSRDNVQQDWSQSWFSRSTS